MDAGTLLGILGVALTLISFVYAVVVTKRSRQEKRLAYERLPPSAIANVIARAGYSIKLIYERPNQEPEIVPSVFVQYVRFLNLGHVPIKRADSAPGDQLRIEVTGGRVLDIVVAEVSRPACQITIDEIRSADDATSAKIDFEFLDFEDGALIQIVTVAPSARAELCGTIIGMPEGIVEAPRSEVGVSWPDMGCIIPIAFEVAALAAVPFFYRYFTGSWRFEWLLVTPVLALLLPLIITMPVVIKLSDRSVKSMRRLRPPTWYRWRRSMSEDDMLRDRIRATRERQSQPRESSRD